MTAKRAAVVMLPSNRWQVVRRAKNNGRVVRIMTVGDENHCARYLEAQREISMRDSVRYATQRLYMSACGRMEFRDETARKASAAPLWRVEATVPAIRYVHAWTREEAIVSACGDGAWEVDADAEIEEDHIVDVQQDGEP